MVVPQQLELSTEETHGPNNGHAKGGSENNVAEPLHLLVSDLGLRQTISICSSCYKPEWSENRPARSAGVDPLQRSASQRFTPPKAPGKGRGGKSIAAQLISAIYALKALAITCYYDN